MEFLCSLLKFARDVKPWRPRVTVVGFLNAGPLRSLGIYAFLRPALELPYSKPRFVLAGDSLVTINSPVVTPKQIVGYEAIESLPHIQLDHWFLRQNWAPPSVDLHILRWLYGRFPRWQAIDMKEEADAARALTSRIMRQLRNEIELAGSRAVMVYLPVLADLTGGGTRHRDGLIADLKGLGIEVVDAGPCMTRQVPLERLFLGEHERRVIHAELGPAHYSPEGNGALARCLAPLIVQLLSGLDDSRVETQ